MSSKTREQKRLEAEARERQRRALSAKQQLDMLDERLGKGVGAKRERERLNALIDKKE